MSQTYVVQLRGGSYKNYDGVNRQGLIAKCRNGECLILRAEPNNPHDRHAVAVLNKESEQLGYLPSDARDASSILRGEKIEARILKRIGGQNLWHKLIGTKRSYGLLIQIVKGEIDWSAHNKHRELAERVDSLVKQALEFEKSGSSQEESVEKYKEAITQVVTINQTNPISAAHRYAQAPINRLTMLLVKLKRTEEAKQVYMLWSSEVDPVGLTKSEQTALNKRMNKLGPI